MKRKLVIALLTASMAITPLSVSAAEFTDGAAAVEMQDFTISPQDAGLAETDLFTDDSSAAGEGFSDSSIQDAEVFSDSAVEEAAVENSTYAAKDMYQLSVSGTLVYSEVQKFVELLNEERAKLGLEPSRLDNEMMELATERAIECAIYYSHSRPDGSILESGECISLIYERASAEDAIDSWKNSPAHWSILMSKEPGRIGFVPFMYKSVNGEYRTNYVVDIWYNQGYTPYNSGFNDVNITKKLNIKANYIDNIRIEIDNLLCYYVPYSIEVGQQIQATALLETESDVYKNSILLNDNCGIWISSNPEIAIVNDHGTITAVSPGKTNIYYYLNGDNNVKLEYGVVNVKGTVQKPDKPKLEGTTK